MPVDIKYDHKHIKQTNWTPNTLHADFYVIVRETTFLQHKSWSIKETLSSNQSDNF